jgi:NAD-dependent dihydropyrimidine dehydrogenase PreA subunit
MRKESNRGGLKIWVELNGKSYYALCYFYLGELYVNAGRKEKALVEQCPRDGFQIADGKSQAENEKECIEWCLCETVFPKLAITVTKNDNPEKIFSQIIRTDLFKLQTDSSILPLPICHFCGLLRII